MPNKLPAPTGTPDAGAQAILAQIKAYISSPVATVEDRVAVIRGMHHVFARAYEGWAASVARGHYDEDPATHVGTSVAGDVSNMPKTTIQPHAVFGLQFLPPAERRRAEEVRAKRSARLLNRRRPQRDGEAARPVA